VRPSLRICQIRMRKQSAERNQVRNPKPALCNSSQNDETQCLEARE
jgi:hypothetical protein